MKESQFQSQLIKYLTEKHGAYAVNYIGSLTAGVPDVLVCIKGKFFAFELKVGTRYKASALQISNIRRIKRAGGIGIVFVYCDNWKQVLDDFIALAFTDVEKLHATFDTYPDLPDETQWGK